MLKSTLLILATSYFAWYLERHEIAMVYPFDASYATPVLAGEPRLAEARFVTDDGEELVVWRAPAETGKPTLLYLPGNAGGLKDRVARFGRLLDQGYGVTALAYRGSSGSTGRPDEASLTSDAASLALVERARPLVLYGESLGTAIAIKLAGRGLGDAVILEAPFTSISELVESQYPNEDLDHLITQRWESLESAPAMTQPLLIIHGTDDRIVPIGMGQAIFEKAGSARKRFYEVPGADHEGIWTDSAQAELFAFLDAL